MDWISVLPNLSIGVVAIGALVYISKEFMKMLDMRNKEAREVEREIRSSFSKQLSENTHVLNEVVRIMDRVVAFLDKK